MAFYRLLFVFTLALVDVASRGAESDWYEGNNNGTDGATRDYYNLTAQLPWTHFMGDWRDRDDSAQGSRPFATEKVIDDDSGKYVRWDVTELVSRWTSGKSTNQGFFLRVVSPSGDIRFWSREHEHRDWRPTLELKFGNRTELLESTADTFLTSSTYRSQGRSDELRVSSAPDHLLIRFDLGKIDPSHLPTKAALRLYSNRQYGDATIGVFQCQQGHDAKPSDPILGLARNYPADRNIESDPHVHFAAGFESSTWAERWTQAETKRAIDTVAEDPDRKFAPHHGKALRVRIAKGANGALNATWKFRDKAESEPTECFFRYYLRLADDWNQTLQGGKLPGISGTYGVAGWGGRRSFGDKGWSARGLFKQTIPDGNPLAGRTPIGTYCYHADMTDQYGTNWLWNTGYRGYLENNRWYCIEQRLRLNTPGKNNGLISAWVDGRPAFEKTDIRFRNHERLKIEQVWMNVYHGGKKPSPYDQHVFIDNVVIADRYIGPMNQPK